MRRRTRLTLSAAAVAAFAPLLAVPPAVGAPAASPQAAAHQTTRSVGSATGTVQLVTGERVRLTHQGKATVAQVDHRASGAGQALVTRTVAGRTTVMPLVAEPYLKRFLDPGLFDVDTLARATGADGRIGVRLTYSGSARPSVPGVQVTSAANGSASGYLTPTSAAAFGRALAAQFQADRKAGWPRRSTLLGVTGIRADAPAATTVSPHFTMFTLIIKVTGSDGKPAPFAFVGYVNVDDGRKAGGFVPVEDGEARVSVPAGHYAFVTNEFDGSVDRIATRDEYQVTRANQVVTVDVRTATSRSYVSTPKPSSSTSYGFEWDRTDARGVGGLGAGFGLDSPTEVRVTPSARPTIGTVAAVQSFTTAQRGASDPAYTYDLAAVDDHVPANLGKTFRAADLGAVGAVYYGDGATKEGAFGRAALYPTSGLVFIGLYPVARPTTRTEYVGSLGGQQPLWIEAGLLNDDSFDDPGFVDAAPYAIAPASYRDGRWFRGPLAPAVPVQTTGGFCYDCRTGDTLTVGLAPFTDSDRTHAGELFGAADGLPVARLRLYRGDTLVEDKDDYLGDTLTVPAAAATYRAVLDVDRRLSDPVLSTRTQTEWTFRSARGSGPAAPKDWYCAGGQDGCRVLPVVQARVSLPNDLQGDLPAGRSTLVVSAGTAQGSAPSAVTTTTLEVRGQGDDWQPLTLKSTGAARYTAVVDNADYAGGYVDLRVSTADQAGSTFRQTTLRAYRVAS